MSGPEPDWFDKAVIEALDADPGELLGESYEMQEVVNTYSDRLLDEYAAKYPEVMDNHAESRNGFEERLNQRWGEAFDMFEFYCLLNEQSGTSVKQHLIDDSEPEDDPLLSALMRLHARACQVSREVLALMRAGYADGAFSRWRALYEIAISSKFIVNHGEDTAQRFLEHKIVDDYFEAKSYREHREELGFESISEGVWEDLVEGFETLVDNYGGVFKTSFGWADPELDKDPSRRAIAENVGLDRYEPYFAFASDTVHGGSKGTLYRLGLSSEAQTDVLLSGATNIGFTDPAQFSAIMLKETTDCLFDLREDIQWPLISLSLQKIQTEVVYTFHSIRRQLKAEISMSEGRGYTIDGNWDD